MERSETISIAFHNASLEVIGTFLNFEKSGEKEVLTSRAAPWPAYLSRSYSDRTARLENYYSPFCLSGDLIKKAEISHKGDKT